MELSPDTLLNNRYRIQRKLGQGGMGAVYLAVDTALDAQVAVKVNRNPAPESTSQFLREARLLAQLRHPNLPRVTHYFILGGAQYLVMDYIPGKDLNTILEEQGPLPLGLVLEWAQQLGDALSYLHQQSPPVIHRDVKPANVRLAANNAAILVDFGIAKVDDASQQATAAGALGYTPGYAPPEQYGGTLRTGPASDQYSFAALVYHLMTGHKPADSVQRALGQATLSSMRLINPSVPEHIQSALEKALSLKPDERFESMGDLIRALVDPSAAGAAGEDTQQLSLKTVIPPPVNSDETRVAPHPAPVEPLAQATGSATVVSAHTRGAAPVNRQQAQPTVVRPTAPPPGAGLPPTPPPVTPPSTAPRRGPNWLIIGGLAIIALIGMGILALGGGGLLIYSILRNTQVQPVAVLVSTTPQPFSVTPALVENTSTPSPEEIVPLSPSDTPVPPPAASATETLPPTATFTPTITPIPLGQGGLIAFASDRAGGQTLQIWTMRVTLSDTGDVVSSDFTQVTSSEGDKRSPVWSPDGTRLLYVAPGGEGMGLDLWVINADGSGTPVNLTQRKGDDTEPAWSPDGNWIAFTNNGREDKVRMIYLIKPDGTGLKRLSTDQEEFGAAWSPDSKWLGFVMNAAGAQIMFMRDRLGPIATPVHDYFVTPKRFDMIELYGNLGQVAEPDWSSDGGWLVYTNQNGGKQRIFIARYPIRQPSQDVIKLSDGPNDNNPAWSPDAQWIVFNSQRDGDSEVYIMRSTGSLQTNLTRSPGQDLDADWQALK